MFKAELHRLKAPDWADIAVDAAVTLTFSILAYLLDHARIVAFALIPSAGLFSIARDLGINWANTPRLKMVLLVLSLALWALAIWWVLAHPRE